MSSINSDTGKQIIALKNHIVAGFNHGNWRELALLINHQDELAKHPRLLRSLSFGDDDYEGHVLAMLQSMVKHDRGNLEIIREYVAKKCPESGEYISSDDNDSRRIVFSPSVFRVPNGDVDPSLVSVMMPFSKEFSEVYSAISSSVSKAGLSCKRADDIWDDATIIQDIFSLIFRSSIVICDFTAKNPNVFYEAGIAHTLGKHVIPITQNPGDIPFDLQHHRYIHYLKNAEGLRSFEAVLADRVMTLSTKRSVLV